jgi:hypothetical protein
MYWIIVSLKTVCGIEGVGEVYSASFHPSVMKRAIEDVFDRYLKGHDPHHVERFFRECYSSGCLGRDVFYSLSLSNTGAGLAAGTGIVLLAIILDRLSQAWTKKQREALGV